MLITVECIDTYTRNLSVNILKCRLSLLNKKVISVVDTDSLLHPDRLKLLFFPFLKNSLPEYTLLYYAASKALLIHEIILPKLNEGYIVVCSSFLDSITAIYHYGNNVPLKTIHTINNFISKNLSPDISFFINFPPEELIKRIPEQELIPPAEDIKKIEYIEKINNGFLKIAKKYENVYHIINETNSIENISNKIFFIVNSKLKGDSL